MVTNHLAPPSAMATPSSALDDVRQVFRNWDKDGKGLISRKEFSGIIRRLCPEIGEEELEALFEAAHATKDNTRLNYEDFFSWLWSPEYDEAEAEASVMAQAEEAENEAARERGLWGDAIGAARRRAMVSFPADRVEEYFEEVQARLGGQQYADRIKRTFFKRMDKNGDGKVDFHDAVPLIRKSLQCAADLGQGQQPTRKEIRAAFDAHDLLVSGRGRMAFDEFLNLTRYLQVRVAEAMLPLSKIVQEDR